MTVKNKTMVNLEENFPALFKEGVFVEKDSFIYLSSKALHQTELNSMFDCACSKLVKQISAFKNKRKLTIISLKSEINPPAITLTICLVQNEAHQVLITQGHSRITASVTKEIDVDVVPAILLRLDNDTYYRGIRVDCSIYTFCKWAENEQKRVLLIYRFKLNLGSYNYRL